MFCGDKSATLCLGLSHASTSYVSDILLFSSAKEYMGVSKNSGTPKLSILIGFSIINYPFWGTLIFGNTHITLMLLLIKFPLAIYTQIFQNIPGTLWLKISDYRSVLKKNVFFGTPLSEGNSSNQKPTAASKPEKLVSIASPRKYLSRWPVPAMRNEVFQQPTGFQQPKPTTKKRIFRFDDNQRNPLHVQYQ